MAQKRDLHQMEAHRAVLADGWRPGGRGNCALRKNLLKSLMGSQMELARRGMAHHELELDRLLRRHGRALNLWVAYNFDTDTWVNFKLFGGHGADAGVRGGARPCIWAATSRKPTDAKGPLA
jgi:hypothetical protein